jgi:two-component system OmpR family response regulator
LKVLIFDTQAGHKTDVVELPAENETAALAELRRLHGPHKIFILGECADFLRRAGALLAHKASRIEHGEVALDLLSRKVFRSGKEIVLKANEFSLLELFLRSPERVLSKREILRKIWGYTFDPGTNVVDVLVHRLRKKLDRGFATPAITTVKGSGYLFR